MDTKHPTWQAIRRELEFGPDIRAEIEAGTKIPKRTLQTWLSWAVQEGHAHICGYEDRCGRPGERFVPIYKVGPGKPASRPKTLTATERSARWRERHKQQYNERQRLRAQRRKARQSAASAASA